MSHHKSNRDYLSKLPSELVDDIFHHAFDSCQPLTTPLSKTLLPFQRRQLFRFIKVPSYKSLENLCMIAESNSYIPSYVRHFTFEVEFDQEVESTTKESEDVGTPSNSAVERFFRQSSNVQLVVISGSTRIALLFLSPSFTSSLARLESLDISSTWHSLPDPLNPSHYTGLGSCSKLDFFSLAIFRSSPSTENSTQSEPLLESNPFRTPVRQLVIIGPLSNNAPSARQFLSSFDSLSLLSLYDTSDSSSFVPDLLDALPAPHKLDALNLGCRRHLNPPIRGAFTGSFKRLTQLRALSLLTDFSSFTSDLYSNIRALPIRILQFASKADVSIPELTALISGPTKHPTLQSVGLNQIKGRIGTRISDVGKPYWDEEQSRWKPYPDWDLPVWTDDFDEGQLLDFLEIAEKQKVVVTGSAVEAIGIVAQRVAEWRLLEDLSRLSEQEQGD
ncbi:hypothetical protein JCM5353_002384 [Sporobolomyces roseus]